MKVIAFISHDEKFGISKEGKIPWYDPYHLKRLAVLSRSQNVLMGRKTWESFTEGKGLPNRKNIVCSRYSDFLKASKKIIAIDNPIEFIKNNTNISENLWIIGGHELFHSTFDYWDEIYVTKIPQNYNCDLFFPDYRKHFSLAYDDMSIYRIYKRNRFVYSNINHEQYQFRKSDMDN